MYRSTMAERTTKKENTYGNGQILFEPAIQNVFCGFDFRLFLVFESQYLCVLVDRQVSLAIVSPVSPDSKEIRPGCIVFVRDTPKFPSNYHKVFSDPAVV